LTTGSPPNLYPDDYLLSVRLAHSAHAIAAQNRHDVVDELAPQSHAVDVALFFVIVCTNLQWVATAAAAGQTSLPVWLIGCAAMFVPISIVVMWLSWKYPDEGGMYMWSKRAFGPFAGFMTGWTYWCTNLPYFPALLYFTAGNALFLSSANPDRLAGAPLYFITVSLVCFAIATILNLLGWILANG